MWKVGPNSPFFKWAPFWYFWNSNKKTTTFFRSKLSKLHKKDPILHVTTTFYLEEGETNTYGGPIPLPLILVHFAHYCGLLIFKQTLGETVAQHTRNNISVYHIDRSELLWLNALKRTGHKYNLIHGRTTLNHATNGVVVDSAGKKQTRVWDILKVWPNLFHMNMVFYNENERV